MVLRKKDKVFLNFYLHEKNGSDMNENTKYHFDCHI